MFTLKSNLENLDMEWRVKYLVLLNKYNTLIDRINEKGGESFLNQEPNFNYEEIKTLISLCHPDRHQGKEAANKITQRLIDIKNSYN